MKRPKIGDIIEIKTAKGLAYALFTHRHTAPPKYGCLIRMFSGFHAKRPEPISGVAAGEIIFSTFFPLGAAVNRGLVEIAGHVEVPTALKPFPVFRNGNPNPQTKKVEVWWLWDGTKEWRVGALTPEQALFPLLSVWNDARLVERVEQGWRAETDPVWAATLS